VIALGVSSASSNAPSGHKGSARRTQADASRIDELIDSGLLGRLLAMTDISFSNSLIESWWRSLKYHRLLRLVLSVLSSDG